MTKTLIIAGIVAATIAGIGAMELIGGLDPMNSHHKGAGWECDAVPWYYDSCAKDVKPPAPRHP